MLAALRDAVSKYKLLFSEKLTFSSLSDDQIKEIDKKAKTTAINLVNKIHYYFIFLFFFKTDEHLIVTHLFSLTQC